MKNLFSFILLLLVSASWAQEKVVVEYKDHAFKNGDHPAFVCLIPETNIQLVEKNFKKTVSNITTKKITTDGFEWSFVGINLKEFKNDSVDVTAAAYTSEGGVMIALAVAMDGAPYPFEENKQAKRQMESEVYDFAVSAYKEKVQLDVNKEEESIIKEIKSAQRKISNLRDDIAQVENEQDLLNKEIIDIKEDLIGANLTPEATAELKSKQKDHESSLKKLKKSEEKMHTSIGGLEEDIREFERRKADLAAKRSELESARDDQKLQVADVQEKLRKIK